MLLSLSLLLKPGVRKWAFYDEASKRVLLALQMGEKAKVEVSIYSEGGERQSLEAYKYTPATFDSIKNEWSRNYVELDCTPGAAIHRQAKRGFQMVAQRFTQRMDSRRLSG